MTYRQDASYSISSAQLAGIIRFLSVASAVLSTITPMNAEESYAPQNTAGTNSANTARPRIATISAASNPQAMQPSTEKTKEPVTASNIELTPAAREIAEISGMMPVWTKLCAQQEKMNSSSSASARNAGIEKLIYYRQQLIQAEQTLNFEVNSARVGVETELAKLDDLQAGLVEMRARSLMRNTAVNFVSGGLTKLAGYSIALGAVDMPTNILEIFDGGVQCALSSLTVREQREERRVGRGITPLLTTITDRNNDRTQQYPVTVWDFLSRVPPDSKSGITRLEILSKMWRDAGLLSRQKRKLSGTSGFDLATRKAMAMQLIQDRRAMLTDVRAEVSRMERSLMEFSHALKQSYLGDPALD